MPFVEKNKARIKPIDNQLSCGRKTISNTVYSTESQAESGMISLNKLNRVSWKLSIGINGMSVNKKINAGNRATKRLKLIAEERVVMAPFTIPR